MIHTMLLQLLVQSDFLTVIVLAILLGMSFICWAIAFYKFFNFIFVKYILNIQEKNIKKQGSFLEIINFARQKNSYPYYFLQTIVQCMQNILYTNNASFAMIDIEIIENQIYQLIDQKIARLESYLSFLNMSAAVAPLLGLFGTVWGLIQAFLSIGQQQPVNIAVIAPGIAHALITTLAGITVAIPAFILHVYLSGRIQFFERKMESIAHSILVTLLLDTRKTVNKGKVCTDNFAEQSDTRFHPKSL